MVFKTRQVWQPQAGSVRLRGRSVSEKRPHNGRFLPALPGGQQHPSAVRDQAAGVVGSLSTAVRAAA